ncbi:MAG TPA: PTS sugar transporter subunit IIA [Firmicutes bacterium]|nr:PTS sugar transporter subunit IIA [Bacillota bacterium]
MLLKDYLAPELIFFDDSSTGKEDSISFLCDAIARIHHLDASLLFHEVMDRESKMTTGMGSHIAVPHARIESLDRFYLACLINKKGIDFKSLDGQPAHIIVLLLSPKRMVKEHISLLSKISYFLTDEGNFQELLNSHSFEDIQKIVQAY